MESLRIVVLMLPVMCRGQFKAGVQDSVEGTIKLLNGINEILEAGKATATNPLRSILSDALFNKDHGILNAATPKLEQLYDDFFNSNSSNTDDTNNATDTYSYSTPVTIPPLNNQLQMTTDENINHLEVGVTQDSLKAEGFQEGKLELLTTGTESLAEYTTESTTGSEFTTLFTAQEVTPTVSVDSITEESILENDRNASIGVNSTTFDYILSLQNNICYKLRSGIDSISNSELIVLLMKFLKYDYLKAREAWERLKVTSDRIWTTALNDDDQYKRSFGSRKVTQVLIFINNIKDEVRSALNILKVPFSTIMRGIKKRLKKAPSEDVDEFVEKKDFCMKLEDAERKLHDTVHSLEEKFSKMLDTKIKEEKEFLEAGMKDPDKFSLLDKETVSRDLFFLKDNIFKIYDYLKNAAIKQLNKLKGVVNKIQN